MKNYAEIANQMRAERLAKEEQERLKMEEQKQLLAKKQAEEQKIESVKLKELLELFECFNGQKVTNSMFVINVEARRDNYACLTLGPVGYIAAKYIAAEDVYLLLREDRKERTNSNDKYKNIDSLMDAVAVYVSNM